MRLIFMGTPEFAVPSLVAVMEAGFSVVSVVTQPDRPRGRSMQVRPTPVKEKALELGLPVMQPERLSNPKWIEVISESEARGHRRGSLWTVSAKGAAGSASKGLRQHPSIAVTVISRSQSHTASHS